MYGDAHATAQALSKAIAAFLAEPTEDTLKAAKAAWVKARVPYQQSEGFRFGNKVVDEWEGKVNAWPLDEGLIDYVDAASYGETSDENPLYRANIIGSRVRPRRPQADRHDANHQEVAGRYPAGSRRRRIERGDGLPRCRVPPLGTGSQRHEGGRGRPSGDRLFADQLHPRQLRTPAPISHGGDQLAGRRSRRHGESLGRQGQSASGPDEEERRGRSVDDSHRSRLTLIWRTRGRAHEAGADPARSRRRA